MQQLLYEPQNILTCQHLYIQYIHMPSSEPQYPISMTSPVRTSSSACNQQPVSSCRMQPWKGKKGDRETLRIKTLGTALRIRLG